MLLYSSEFGKLTKQNCPSDVDVQKREQTLERMQFPVNEKYSPPPLPDVAVHLVNDDSSTRSFVSIKTRIPPPLVEVQARKIQFKT